MRFSTLLILTSVLVACSPRPPDATPATAVPTDDRTSPLAAHVTPPRLDVAPGTTAEVTLTIENRSSTPQRVDARVLEIAQLALTVTRDGVRVAPLPPPVPTERRDDDLITLAPGATHAVRLRLTAFSPPLSPGEYVVRAAGYPGAAAVVVIR